MAGLRCAGVAKAYGARQVLHEVDLEVRSGSLTAILGASGSGKTTLLRIVMGFVDADAGIVEVDGRLLADGVRSQVPAHRRGIGYVAQEGALFPHLSVGDNVRFGLPRQRGARGRAPRTPSGRAAEVLELVGLSDDYGPRPVHELSGGEQRRVALARALAPSPPLVLLDEPFSGLDAGLRAETRRAVSRALAQEGTTALLVTHDQGEALSMGDEVGVLRGGRLVQQARPTELYRIPIDLDTARLVGDAVVLEGAAEGPHVSCSLGRLLIEGPICPGPVHVLIRPEQIRMHRSPTPGGLLRAAAGADGYEAPAAVVLDHARYGPDTVVRLRLNGEATGTILAARTFARELPEPGEVVELTVDGAVAVYPTEPRA